MNLINRFTESEQEERLWREARRLLSGWAKDDLWDLAIGDTITHSDVQNVINPDNHEPAVESETMVQYHGEAHKGYAFLYWYAGRHQHGELTIIKAPEEDVSPCRTIVFDENRVVVEIQKHR